MELKTIQDLIKASGFKRTFIYAQIKQGNLPKPIKIGRCSRWKATDVEQWLASLSGDEKRGLSRLAVNQAGL